MGTKELLDKLNMTNNFDCWSVFSGYASKGILTEKTFNKGLAYAWIIGKPDTKEEAESYFLRSKRELIMNAEELAKYNSLDNVITLYRGTKTEEAESEDYGLSWTLDRKVAEFFAFRGKHFPKSDGVVISTYIEKAEIRALFLDRDESEAILLPDVCWVDAKVVERA